MTASEAGKVGTGSSDLTLPLWSLRQVSSPVRSTDVRSLCATYSVLLMWKTWQWIHSGNIIPRHWNRSLSVAKDLLSMFKENTFSWKVLGVPVLV